MNIKNEIKDAFTENKKIFMILLLFFIIGIIIGWILADDIAPILMPVLKEALGADDMNSIDAFYIMSHNVSSGIITFVASIFFGIFAILSIFANGFAIGFMGGYTVKSLNDLAIFLVLIVPHGILEIPALFCSCASGIILFLFIFKVLNDKAHDHTFKEAYDNNKNTLKHSITLIIIAVILFIIAALIEGFVTPELGNMVNMQLTGQSLF